MSWGFGGPFLAVLASIIGVTVAVLIIVFVLVPLFKGVGWAIGGLFKGVGWFFLHLFEFVFGMIGDVIRFIGGIPVFLITGALSIVNVVIGRWSAAGHFANSAKRECKIGTACLYRAFIRRPLKLVMLHGLLEGFEQRLPEAMNAAPGRDLPTRRTGQFDGYTIVGSLPGGGSGSKLYIAEPSLEKRAAIPGIPDRVVIKAFALSDGSSLPQIVRESRALECAKSMGHVLEHAMNESRFHYVMPYIPGDHLGIVARDLHARSDGSGLSTAQIAGAAGYIADLVGTLAAYHKGGFWHKDVKPENVIVHDGKAHLVDLGLVTSLRSAMTLTTHGTEYFRDPEMVRQALRGVKVHQVDGAKFDIYAAGAVLYFMLEGTFPAHGGLSAFQKRSPEALHWIVRRAMAEYNQRYPSAEVMLADLNHVLSATDPFAVKPIDLPSMSGAAIPEMPAVAPQPAVVGGPRFSPRPPAAEPAVAGYGIAAGVGAKGAFAQVGQFALDAEGNPINPPSSKKPRRPRLSIRNWWTGEYAVDDAGDATGIGIAPTPEAAPAGVASVWAGAPGVRSSGRDAREQRKSAQSRAAETRRRALSRMPHRRAVAEGQPGGMLLFLGVCLLVGIGLLVAATTGLLKGSARGGAAAIGASEENRPLVLLLNLHDRPDHPAVQEEVNEVIERNLRKGYNVEVATAAERATFGDVLRRWWNDQRGPADDELEEMLEQARVYGIVEIRGEDPGDSVVQFVRSTRPGAVERTATARHSQPVSVLVVNDYPQKNTEELPARIREHIRENIGGGVRIVQDPSAAGIVRDLLLQKEEGYPGAAGDLDECLAGAGVAGVVWFERDDESVADGESFITRIHTRRGFDAQRAMTSPFATAQLPSPAASDGKLLLVNDHSMLSHPTVIRAEAEIFAYYRRLGYDILTDLDAELAARALFNHFRVQLTPTEEENLRRFMAERGLAGLIRIHRGANDAAQPQDSIALTLIEATDAAALDSESIAIDMQAMKPVE
jgi:serine/threonine protein kinase